MLDRFISESFGCDGGRSHECFMRYTLNFLTYKSQRDIFGTLPSIFQTLPRRSQKEGSPLIDCHLQVLMLLRHKHWRLIAWTPSIVTLAAAEQRPCESYPHQSKVLRIE